MYFIKFAYNTFYITLLENNVILNNFCMKIILLFVHF